MNDLGPTTPEEKHVLRILLTVLGFSDHSSIHFSSIGLVDAIISMGCAVALLPFHLISKKEFFIGMGRHFKTRLGHFNSFGGGLALAKGMSLTGIVSLITDSIAAANLNVFLTATLLILLMLFMTELMSNVALVAVLLPVVGYRPRARNSHLYLLIPVTMASSCAFMLLATPPNAIVFASGYIKVAQMARVGIFINLIAVAFLVIYFNM